MVYRKITSQAPVAAYLAATIQTHLKEGQKVLWLVPGGSSIVIAAQVSTLLAGQDLQNLMITLTDERFGPVGHVDSNWQQLAAANFEVSNAQGFPVLSGVSLEETVSHYDATLTRLFDQADFKLGFFGMGADGHTAGNLPGSPALNSSELAAGYDAGTFIRLTMTPKAIAKLDEAVLYTHGDEKRTALENLQKDLPLIEQPAQILKRIPVFTIFNDQIGEAA